MVGLRVRTRRGVRAIAGLSGAQAAAADLARIRAPAEPVEEPDEAMIESAGAVFTACDAFFKTCRTYPEGNPALERFLLQLEAKLRAHVDRYEDLEAEVTAKGIAVEGTPVYEMERADQNLWYPLYRDGVRQLTFGEGIERDEIVALFRALVALAATLDDEDLDEGEDDAVTILWDLDLPHVSYVSIDTFVGGAGGDAAAAQRMDRIREVVTIGMMKDLAQANLESGIGQEVGIARRMKSIALSKADLKFLEQENLGVLGEVPHHLGKARDGLFAIAPVDRDAFALAVKEDPELVDKFLEALIRALLTEGGSGEAEALCTRIEQFFTATVVSEAFARATSLRRQAVSVLENRGGTPAKPELIERVDQAMSSDAAVAAVVGALAKRADDQLAELYALVEALPRRAAPAIVRTLEQVGERTRRRVVCDTLAKWGPRALEAAVAVLPNSGEEYALDILYLIRKIGTERAVSVLEEACRHGSPQVRGNALRLYAEVAPKDAVGKRARTAMRDPDSLVRGLALEALVHASPPGAAAWVRELITAEGFSKEADAPEKARLFSAYARLGGAEAGPDLLARLSQRNMLLSARVDEERAAAAMALAQIKYEPARELVEKLAKSKLARSGLNEACVKALELFGPEPDDEDDEDGEPAAVQPVQEQPSAPRELPPVITDRVSAPDAPFVRFKPKGPKGG
jgi:hypothetical protein